MKRKPVTVTIRINKDGSQTFRSTGGFDLRKLFFPVADPFMGDPKLEEPKQAQEGDAK